MPIKKILISQNAPSLMSPYQSLTEKFGVEFVFNPFFTIEPLSSREFRSQRVNIADYTAIIFSSRHCIDAFFRLAEEMRVKIPETMKYFCSTEAVAMYLQKHIVYRKRKIFYGTGTPDSIVALIGPKHKGEKFLLTTADANSVEALSSLLNEKKLDFTVAEIVKSVSRDLSGVNLNDFDMIVFYHSSDVRSLQDNFPDFKQGDIKFISFGRSSVRAMEEAGIEIAVKAPTPEIPSVAKAIELYLKENA